MMRAPIPFDSPLELTFLRRACPNDSRDWKIPLRKLRLTTTIICSSSPSSWHTAARFLVYLVHPSPAPCPPCACRATIF